VRAANLISNDPLERTATIVRARAALSDQILSLKDKTWIARLKTGREATFPTSVSRTFNAAALTALVAVEGLVDSVVIASVAAAVVDLAVLAAGAAAGLADSVAAADLEAGDEN
jgi:hypothetical protein